MTDDTIRLRQPTAFETRSTHWLVSSKLYLGTIGIQIWMPRLPVVLG